MYGPWCVRVTSGSHSCSLPALLLGSPPPPMSPLFSAFFSPHDRPCGAPDDTHYRQPQRPATPLGAGIERVGTTGQFCSSCPPVRPKAPSRATPQLTSRQAGVAPSRLIGFKASKTRRIRTRKQWGLPCREVWRQCVAEHLPSNSWCLVVSIVGGNERAGSTEGALMEARDPRGCGRGSLSVYPLSAARRRCAATAALLFWAGAARRESRFRGGRRVQHTRRACLT